MNCYARLTDLPENDPQIQNDFDKRYQHTYLRLTDKEGVRAISYIGRDGNSFHFAGLDNQPTLIHKMGTHPDLCIEPLLPDVGYYNVSGVPVYLYKVPQRQWKRSFCKNIYYTPTTPTTSRQQTDQFWHNLAKAVINPVYAKLDEITKKIFSYVALNHKFAIQEAPTGEMCLLYRQYVVGTLDFNTKTVQLLQPVLEQEVRDFFKYTGVQEWKLK